MNLAGNARDAMPAGGRLVFAMRRRVLADRVVGDLVAGQYVELAVSDEGTGIPDDLLPHLFEPFFSTKGARGTGLGLATCFGIVAQAGGTIRVESALGKGTTFRVFLPAADAGQAAVVSPLAARDVRRVLVVDDDASVREMTTRMLRSDGHEVHTASTLAEARRVLEDDSIALDAVLTDVVLGNERGTDLIEPCRRTRPQARIVVTSGYTPDPGASQSQAMRGAGFLPKPFGRDQLLRALRGL
jgi:CheY-like chemotaxis protein